MSARDHLDAGIDALGLLGGPADLAAARQAFRRAVAADPGMCDAWLGLIATGDHASDTLRRAQEASATVHRETRRLGLPDTAIDACVSSPGFIAVYAYTAASIALAHIAALLTEGDYDTAEKLLETYDPHREPVQSPIWRCLGVTLHYLTQRWPDALAWSQRPVTGSAPVVDAATDLMAGIAHVGLGEFDAALAVLGGIPDHQLSPAAAAYAGLYRGLALRSLGREADARAALSTALIEGRLLGEASSALADPTYGPVCTTAAAIAARASRFDPSSGPSPDDLQRAEQQEAAKAALADADRAIASFIGLNKVKAHIETLKFEQVYDRAMAARGEQIGQRESLHLTLVGPPGTAKTSVAREISRMYFGLGLLESPEFIEVKRDDLVGDVIGGTETKMGPILKTARGRTLFIDEAPELYVADNERDFGRIALNMLNKFSEDHRHDTLIALAGYPGEMDQMMSANPGLRGRFPNQLEFSSYTATELDQIAELFAEENKVLVQPDAIATFRRIAQWLTTTQTGNPRNPTETLVDIPGNGRYVRNVITEAVKRMKARVASDPSINMATADRNVLRTMSVPDMTAAIETVLTSAGLTWPEQLR